MHYQLSVQVVFGSPAFYNNDDYYYNEVQPVRLGGSRNLLEIPNMLFNNLAKAGMGKHMHVVHREREREVYI